MQSVSIYVVSESEDLKYLSVDIESVNCTECQCECRVYGIVLSVDILLMKVERFCYIANNQFVNYDFSDFRN